MKKLDHLEKIALFYETFVIDLWGVMHDGIKLYPNAAKAVEHLISMKKKIVFLSNAPRPSLKVVNFLKKMKMKDHLLIYLFHEMIYLELILLCLKSSICSHHHIAQ